MDERDWLGEQFEAQRPHLRAVALRMLGSAAEADDAVQEAWLRWDRADPAEIHNLRGWLTTVVGRICLDQLRARTARGERPLTAALAEDAMADGGADPVREAELADSIGLALLTVLDTLAPAERLVFVLHDIFAVPFAEIAPVVERSVDATKMMGSRARHRVRAVAVPTSADRARSRAVVAAFLAASREGDFAALLALLDPAVTFRADPAARSAGSPGDLTGAASVAGQFRGRARGARLALIDGNAGAVWAPGGTPTGAFAFTVASGLIVAIELICDRDDLARLDIAILAAER